MLFFVAIVSSFFVSQGGGHLDPRTHDYVSTWHPISVPSILWLNTALLLISSFTMEMGRRQLFREIDVMEEWLGLGRPALRRAIPWLAATAVAGSLFLLGQWVAWNQMWTDKELLASDPARYFFYLITGSPRHSPYLRDSRALRRAGVAVVSSTRGVSPDPRGLYGLVLALHGYVLALPVRPARPRTMKKIILGFVLARSQLLSPARCTCAGLQHVPRYRRRKRSAHASEFAASHPNPWHSRRCTVSYMLTVAWRFDRRLDS